MPELKIEMTEAELFSLDLIAVDKQAWADNVLTNRARVATEDLKTTPEWAKAMAAVATDKGDVTDDAAILLKGRDLGIFVTAKAKHEIAEAAVLTGVQPGDDARPTADLVDQILIMRKMTLTNARDRVHLDEIVQRGLREGISLMQKKSLGELTIGEVARMGELQQFGATIDALEAARDAIKADVESGAITTIEQVQNDARWPK